MSLTKTTFSMIDGANVNIADFGPIGNSVTGDDATFQAALDYICQLPGLAGAQGTLEFEGTIYLASPKNFGANTRLIGKGRNFRSTISPLASFSGAYLFGIDGDNCTGGYAFRIRHEGFTINNSAITTKAQLPVTYLINSAYDIALRDVWIYSARGTGIQISLSNLVMIEDCSLYGITASTLSAEYGIRILSSGSGGGVKIINPDIEVWFYGIQQETNAKVDLINPYCERNITGWRSLGTSDGHLTVIGGQTYSPGVSGNAAVIQGPNTTVIGGVYKANGGGGLIVNATARQDNVHLIGVSGDITDAKNYAIKANAAPTNWYPSEITNYKTPADNVATTFFDVICPHVSSYFGVCEVTVNARDVSGYSMWTAKYRFAFSNPDGTLRVTAVTEYGKANVNISANYGLAISCALSTSGTTISFEITGNTSGALGEGTAPRISASAEMVTWNSTGAVYIQAV